MSDNEDEQYQQQQHDRHPYSDDKLDPYFARYNAKQEVIKQKARAPRPLPVEITSYLEESTSYQVQDNFRQFKRDLSRYHDEQWTVPEEINEELSYKLKNHKVDTTKAIHSIYKGSEIIRTQAKATTELYEQLTILQEGNMPQDEAHQLLGAAVECAKRIAIHAWYHAKKQDNEATQYAAKAMRVPKHLRPVEVVKDNGKKNAFSEEFLEKYYEATFQQQVLRSATGGGPSYYGNGRGSNNYNQRGNNRGYHQRGKNYRGGRGRGNPTYQPSSHQQDQQYQSTGNTEPRQ